MKRATAYAVKPISILSGVLLSLIVGATTAGAQITNPTEIRAKIAELERQQEELDHAIRTGKELIPLLDSNEYILYGPTALERKKVESFLLLQVLTGKITRQKMVEEIEVLGRAKKEFQAELRKELPQLEQQLAKTQDDISYYVNELARINDKSSPTFAGAGRWVLQAVVVSPEKPPEGWTYSADSGSAKFKLYNGDAADFTWTAPPQQIDGTGFTIKITVQSPKFESSMKVSGTGLQGDTVGMEAGPVHSPSSQSKSATFNPQPGFDSLEVKITAGSITFTYKYRRT